MFCWPPTLSYIDTRKVVLSMARWGENNWKISLHLGLSWILPYGTFLLTDFNRYPLAVITLYCEWIAFSGFSEAFLLIIDLISGLGEPKFANNVRNDNGLVNCAPSNVSGFYLENGTTVNCILFAPTLLLLISYHSPCSKLYTYTNLYMFLMS